MNRQRFGRVNLVNIAEQSCGSYSTVILYDVVYHMLEANSSEDKDDFHNSTTELDLIKCVVFILDGIRSIGEEKFYIFVLCRVSLVQIILALSSLN